MLMFVVSSNFGHKILILVNPITLKACVRKGLNQSRNEQASTHDKSVSNRILNPVVTDLKSNHL